MRVILNRFKTDLQAIFKEEGYYDDYGDYIEGTTTTKTFKGAVLPLSEDDFIKNPDSGYTKDDRKIYTELMLENGQTIIWKGKPWTIEGDLDYDYINPTFKRYYITKRGGISD